MQSGIYILDRNIEIKRRLIADDIVRTDPEQFGENRDEIQHGAVADDHALGRAGRAGGEIAVQRVAVDCAAADMRQQRVVCLRLQQVLDQQDASHAGQLRGQRSVFPIGHNAGGLQDRQDLRQPRLRQRGRERNIKAACVRRAEKGIQGFAALFQQHWNRCGGGEVRGKRGAAAAAAEEQHIKAVCAVFVDDSGFFRPRGGSVL